MNGVRRTQVYLEHGLYEALRREAFAERKTISARLREILARHFNPRGKPKRGAAGLLEISGMVKGLEPDLGRRHDDYLADDLEAELEEKRCEFFKNLR